ncbi:uncharacterized protein LOC141690920 [Apium graveolens]|uniref:uncharacterized protein LOC141690920 n=1 Tax=Apium graveolens TaxID=4045 RepID=UPI003D7BFCB7
MKKNKAPGPDGVNVEFFMAAWSITGPSFCEAVRHFFCPWFLAPRLKLILPFLVDIAQSAFIPGRFISYNILLAQELFLGYERETSTPKWEKKIDLPKAFDSDFVDWFDSTFAIPRGNIPVHFLGVPLISSQMCINDYMSLIEKITSRLNSWENLLLSLAGRTLLIKSVIHAIEAFWGNHFLLPMAVHANIQSHLSRFLWKGNINHKGGAKVSLTIVYLPREEGGLGLKNMVDWNRTQILIHLIRVIIHNKSLWPTWVNKIVLKNKHFWTLDLPIDASWIWRKILRLRSMALQFIYYSISTGENVSLWFEPWWGNICLANTKSSVIISQYGLHHSDKVWRERNARAHGRGVFGPHKLLQGIIQDINARLATSIWFSKIICKRPDLVTCAS